MRKSLAVSCTQDVYEWIKAESERTGSNVSQLFREGIALLRVEREALEKLRVSKTTQQALAAIEGFRSLPADRQEYWQRQCAHATTEAVQRKLIEVVENEVTHTL